MAGIDPPELVLPRRPETREPRTILSGQALYTTDIHSHIDGISADDNSDTHEVEVKVDQDGVVSMDIYTPRTLVNSFPLRGGEVPVGVLDNFQLEVSPSNNRENVLCVIHQTSEGPKHKYLIFKRREEMTGWMDRLTMVQVLTNTTRRPTDPTCDRFPPNTKRDGKPLSAFNPDCFKMQEGDDERGYIVPTKSPVEDDYPFDDDNPSEEEHSPTSSDILEWGLASQLQMGISSTSIAETRLPVPPAAVAARSPSISAVSNAGEISQRARNRHGRTKSNGVMFSELLQETYQSELTIAIPVEEACLLKMFDYQGHAWIRDCNGSSGLYAGDLINTINGVKVTGTKVFRDRVEAMTAENQVVQLTVERLPEASLLLVETLPGGRIPFTTEGTKVKSVDVEADEGLFKKAKEGIAYITNINGQVVPYSSTTAEVTAHLQNAGDEFFLVLHPMEFAEKIQ